MSLITSISRYPLHDFLLEQINPKQKVRPDSLWQTASSLFPRIREYAAFQCGKVFSLFNRTVPQGHYLLALSAFEKLSSENKEPPSDSETAALLDLFKGLMEKRKPVSSFDGFSKNSNVIRNHLSLQRMLSIDDDAVFRALRTKIESLSLPLTEIKDKLCLKDCLFISHSSAMKERIAALKELGVQGLDRLSERWEWIHTASDSALFQEIKKLCYEARPPGTIFIGDYEVYEAIEGRSIEWIKLIDRLFTGTMGHMAIFIKVGDHGLGLSHANMITGTHSITKVRRPLFLPLSHGLKIDISPLIPRSLSNELQARLIQVFEEAFLRIASELHPELPLSSFPIRFRLIHKQLAAEELNQIDFPPSGTPIKCSSYVALVFLKAVNEMNKALEKEGYSERIPHPFGKHEDWRKCDILRLIYLWNELKIVREIPPHPTLAKIMELPKPWWR